MNQELEQLVQRLVEQDDEPDLDDIDMGVSFLAPLQELKVSLVGLHNHLGREEVMNWARDAIAAVEKLTEYPGDLIAQIIRTVDKLLVVRQELSPECFHLSRAIEVERKKGEA